MHRNKLISVIVPCYNEGRALGGVLSAMPSFVDETIVVDNGSTDDTAVVASRHGAKVVSEGRRGYGYAIKAGIAQTKGDYLAVLDGDGSYPVEEIEKLLNCALDKGKDLVSGCRYPLMKKDAQPAINVIANHFISQLIGILFRVNLKDSQSGMFVFNKELLNRTAIENNGFGFAQELKIRALLHPDIDFKEMHITYHPRKGRVKFRKIRDSFLNLSAVLSLWYGRAGCVVVAVCIGCIGALLRLNQYFLNRSLWGDEACLAVNIVQRSFAGLWQKLEYGQFATIGFAVSEKLLTLLFGTSEYVLRLIPLACGLASIFLFYKLAKIALEAAYLPLAMAYFALSGRLIFYSAQVKEYSVDLLISIAFCLGMMRVLRKPLTKKKVAIYAVMGAVSVWFAAKAAFMLAAFALAMTATYIRRRQAENALRLAPAYIAWIMSFVLFYAAFAGNFSKGYVLFCLDFFRSGVIPIPPARLSDIARYFQVLKSSISFLTVASFPTVLSIVLFIGLFRVWKKDREMFYILFSPIAIVLFAAFLWKYPVCDRLILFLAPFVIIFISGGVIEISKRAFRFSRVAGALFVILAMLTLPCFNTANVSAFNMHIHETRPVMNYVKGHFREGDCLCICMHAFGRSAFEYYRERLDFKRGVPVIIARKSKNLREAKGSYVRDLNSLRGKKRVWIIFSQIQADHKKFIDSYLDGMGKKVDEVRKEGTSAYLYDMSG